MRDPFYIGYQKQAPALLAAFLRRKILPLFVILPMLFVFLAAVQSEMDPGVFEFGISRAFEGVLYESPVPMLYAATGTGANIPLILAGAGKFGLPDFARGAHGKQVRFNGSLIHRKNLAMIEMNDAESFTVVGDAPPDFGRPQAESAGAAAIEGELVDTKCFFGVMRPAAGKVHRACAIRCLSGGVPPGVLMHDGADGGLVVLLAGPENEPLVYDKEWAARMVRAEGRLEWHDGVPILRTDRIALADGAP